VVSQKLRNTGLRSLLKIYILQILDRSKNFPLSFLRLCSYLPKSRLLLRKTINKFTPYFRKTWGYIPASTESRLQNYPDSANSLHKSCCSVYVMFISLVICRLNLMFVWPCITAVPQFHLFLVSSRQHRRCFIPQAVNTF